ncbi:MAG TPA: hypothetical protein VD994_14980, partial [Prosthecobacter sp.]|nr:hypothetical protein [Prosthecobacter sp.]
MPTEFYLDPTRGGFVRREISESFLGPLDDAVSRLGNAAVRKLPSLCDCNGIPLSFASKGTELYVGGQLQKLSIKAPIEARDGRIFPKFDGQPSTITELPYTPPANMQVWFVVTMTHTRSVYRPGYCYLAARGGSPLGWFRLPLPNVYDDARVCMGDTPIEEDRVAANVWR